MAVRFFRHFALLSGFAILSFSSGSFLRLGRGLVSAPFQKPSSVRLDPVNQFPEVVSDSPAVAYREDGYRDFACYLKLLFEPFHFVSPFFCFLVSQN